MDHTTQLLILFAAAAVGILATVVIRRRQRDDRDHLSRETPFATSTEGEKRCPNCGMFNTALARNCVSCKRRLPG
ncbi:MAG TPA: hypothetical protein VFY18_11965 [Candidatus Limnocylindrales bacterium]|nr:hypothetical protein [Candidatus Limnocylindrales bacterium]